MDETSGTTANEERPSGRRSSASTWMRARWTEEAELNRAGAAADSLPLYQVIEEEYLRLHGGEDGAVRAEQKDWRFTPAQILDPQDLARRLHQASGTRDSPTTPRPPDAVSRYVLEGEAALLAALRAYRRAGCPLDGPITDAFRAAVTTRLNGLLASETLHREGAFRSLALSPYATQLRERGDELSGEERSRLYRLFIETAYPAQLERMRDRRLGAIFARIRGKQHAALCLSGGGIRSAIFALGVVQGLARHGILGAFDYLSTVSGGGYLGAWLSAWMTHAGPAYVQSQLAHDRSVKLEPEPAPIRHLRAHSNYLSPRLGILSADTWTLIATYCRNVLLNWLVLLPLVAAVVTVPWIALAVVGSTSSDWWSLDAVRVGIGLSLIGFVAGALAVAFVHDYRPDPGARQGASRPKRPRTQTEFLQWCLAPLTLSAVLLTTTWKLWVNWGHTSDVADPHRMPLIFAATGIALHLTGWLAAARTSALRRRREMIGIIVSGGVVGYLTFWIARAIEAHFSPLGYVTVAMPVFLGLLMLGGQLFVGVTSRWTGDPEREWSARFNAWVLIVMVSWVAFSAAILWGPFLIESAMERAVAAGLGSVSGVITILLGRSAKTPGKTDKAQAGHGEARLSIPDRLRQHALSLAAPIFSVTIVIALSIGDAWLIRLACKLVPRGCRSGAGDAAVLDAAASAHPVTVLAVAVLLLVAGLLCGWFIDTNKFSLHAMYRARLIRAFLGASRPGGERQADPFTGFDETDDLRLEQLWPSVTARMPLPLATSPRADAAPPCTPAKQPLHVLNLSLNLVGGDNLAWQERKAESFTMTPLHAGAPFVGYRRTSPPAEVPGAPPSIDPAVADLWRYGGDTLSLGTAITISGAAASPNAGYHSSPVITFLMTLFNARLGAWLGNPGPAGRRTHYLSAPRLTVRPILAELFGLTTDRSKYVHLSDGGHFDNLGLYEMVLRRCRYIVVSDASCDAACSFEDLGNAIRKIRIDLGVPIEFTSELPIFPRAATERLRDGRYWAMGRIRYSCVDRNPADPAAARLSDEEYDGVLIYIKPAFYGANEPRDVYNYARANASFPHEDTTDQFFSESQFESYRALGSYIVEQLCATEPAAMRIEEKEPSRDGDPLRWFEYRVRNYGTPRRDAGASPGGTRPEGAS
jgi:hypothetical protein